MAKKAVVYKIKRKKNNRKVIVVGGRVGGGSRAARRCCNAYLPPARVESLKVEVCDFAKPLLDISQAREKSRGRSKEIHFLPTSLRNNGSMLIADQN